MKPTIAASFNLLWIRSFGLDTAIASGVVTKPSTLRVARTRDFTLLPGIPRYKGVVTLCFMVGAVMYITDRASCTNGKKPLISYFLRECNETLLKMMHGEKNQNNLKMIKTVKLTRC